MRFRGDEEHYSSRVPEEAVGGESGGLTGPVGEHVTRPTFRAGQAGHVRAAQPHRP